MSNTASTPLPPLPTERLAIEHFPPLTGRRALVISPGRAQIAKFLVEEREFEAVQAWYVDLHDATQAGLANPAPMEIICGSDLPDSKPDLVAMPVLKRGEAEFTRELMQQAHQRLNHGGHLLVSVDHPKDSWLHEQMQALFDKVSCIRNQAGCIYWGKKTKAIKKLKDFHCRFAFRDDNERLIQAISRPSVFSHRRVDAGARQLMLAAEIGPDDRVLDMGCGTGTIALAAAMKTQGTVFGVDSNARAVECLRLGAELNQFENVSALLNADGELQLPTEIDLALANPPYYGDDRIAQHFVDSSMHALRPGGALLVVTKKPRWYEEYFATRLEDIAIFESGRYFVACGRKP